MPKGCTLAALHGDPAKDNSDVPSYLHSSNRGMAAVDQHIAYLRVVHAGAVVTIRSTRLELKERSVRFVHEMSDDEHDRVVARTTLKAVHMDTVARKSCSFEAAIVQKAGALLGKR